MALRALGWLVQADAPKPAPVTRERHHRPGPLRPPWPRTAPPRRRMVLVNLTPITAWAATGTGFWWFAFVLVPSAIGVAGWARQGHREATAR